MYQVPLRFIKVSPTVVVCATRIVAIMSVESFQARETIKAERRAGTLINAAGGAATQCAIFMDNGAVIASPYSVTRLSNAIAKAETKFDKLGGEVKVDLSAPDEEIVDGE